MIKLLVFIIITTLILLINRLFLRKNKRFFPLILLVLSIVYIGFGIAPMIYLENKNKDIGQDVQEVQKVSINTVSEDETIVCNVSAPRVVTHKSNIGFNLLKNFVILNIPTALCLGDIYLSQRRTNSD